MRPPSRAPCIPDVPGLSADLIFTLVAENVRDYAIFLMDADAEEHLRNAASTGEYNGEGHRVRRDGSTLWAYVTLTALYDADGKLVGFTKVTRDFSARRAIEARLTREAHLHSDADLLRNELEQLKRRVAHVSHELRSPLSAILGSASLLSGESSGSERQQTHIERLQRSGTHALQIVNDLLDISRAEGGHLPVSLDAQRLGPVIHEALADAQPQAAARGLAIVNAVSGAATDLPYWGDEARVRQILVNVLSNATKFTEPGGRITVSGGTGETVTGAELAGPGPWVYVRVEDTGRGIPQERLQAIFEPYQQSQADDQFRGGGLGLAISRHLARLMGGDLTVQSEVGAGSTFTLWLLIAPSEPVPR